MDEAEVLKRCKELDAEAREIAVGWINSGFENDYHGKIVFSMAVARAVMLLTDNTPGIFGTGQDFLDAVKEGAKIWVEEGEPSGPPSTQREQRT
jgi:hypothetical protein